MQFCNSVTSNQELFDCIVSIYAYRMELLCHLPQSHREVSVHGNAEGMEYEIRRSMANTSFLVDYTICRFLFILVFFFAANSWAQDKDSDKVIARLDSIEAKATRYSENHPIEKIYFHFDRDFYLLGEESWYKAYIVTEPDLSATDISFVLYVDWIDPGGKVIRH